MVLTKKAKCQGCKALRMTDTNIECTLGFPVDFEVINKEAIKPKPVDRCYKPKSPAELKKAKEMIEKAKNEA